MNNLAGLILSFLFLLVIATESYLFSIAFSCLVHDLSIKGEKETGFPYWQIIVTALHLLSLVIYILITQIMHLTLDFISLGDHNNIHKTSSSSTGCNFLHHMFFARFENKTNVSSFLQAKIPSPPTVSVQTILNLVFDTLKDKAFFTLKDNMCSVKSHSIFLTFLQKKKNLTRQHNRHVCM